MAIRSGAASGRRPASPAAAVLAILFAAGFFAAGGAAAAQEDGGSFFEEAPAAEAGGLFGGLSLSGSLTTVFRAFPDADDPAGTPVSAFPLADVELAWRGDAVDLVFRGTARQDAVPGSPSARVEEAYGRVYLGPADLQLGWIKQEWGKGDGLHAVDVLNATDFGDFRDYDEVSWRLPEPMAKLDLHLGPMAKLELAYLPTFTPDSFPRTGRWAHSEAVALQASVEAALKAWGQAYYAQVYTSTMTQMSTALQSQGMLAGQAAIVAAAQAETAASLAVAQAAPAKAALALREPDTRTLEFGQGALRFTTTTGPVDWGLVGYAGFLRRPAARAFDLYVPAVTAASDPRVELSYERTWMLGAEAAGVLAGFNLRGEAAGYLTKDLSGDDPAAKNPLAVWVAGFDRDFLEGKLNLNAFAKGEHVLVDDKISSPADVDKAEHYSTVVVVAKLGAKLLNETLSVSALGSYRVEDRGWKAKPEVAWTWKDVAVLTASYSVFGGPDDSTFGQYAANDNLALSLKVSF